MERTPPPDPLARLQRVVRSVDEIPIAPWNVWHKTADTEVLLRATDALSREGQIEEALVRYQDFFSRAEQRGTRQAALIRQLGSLLQLGQSQRALEEAAAWVREENFSTDAIPSGVSLMVGYAYLHQRNLDQAIAWFAKAQQARDPGAYSAQAKVALRELIESLPVAVFEEHAGRWRADPSVGSYFTSERIRRSQGGAVRAAIDTRLYQVDHYRRELPAPVQLVNRPASAVTATSSPTETTTQPMAIPQGQVQRKVGLLLPLSGQYAEHALKVKHGVELACATAVPPVELVSIDTQGDPIIAEQGYLSLVNQGAGIVLGPLLVRTTEQVAARSIEARVPIISFTKRAGIPQLGPEVFRLGVTTENQVDELLQFSMGQLGLSSFAMLVPQTETGLEFANYFRVALAQQGARLIAEQPYDPSDEASMTDAVARLSLSRPSAIFIPDRLDEAFALLDALEKTESLKDAVLLGTALWDDPVAVRGYGQLLDGAVFVTPFFQTSVLPEIGVFTQRYREAYQHSPELLAAQAFDATQLAIRALDRSLVGQGSVSQALASEPEADALTGRLRVDASGDILRRMSVLRLFRGEVVEVMARGQALGITPGQEQGVSAENAQTAESELEQLERAAQSSESPALGIVQQAPATPPSLGVAQPSPLPAARTGGGAMPLAR